jgi:IclR family acetate operon transcriptional repressor
LHIKQEKLKEFSSLKAIQILEAVTTDPNGLTIKKISDETGLSASTIHRIVQELTECGYTRRSTDNKVLIGFDTMEFSMRVKTSDYLFEASKDEMVRLNNLSGETIHLIKQEEDKGVYIGKLEAKNTVGLKSRVGKSTPLYCTSGGKLILTYQDEKWLNNYLNHIEMVPCTDFTITNKEQLLVELAQIKEQGYSLDNKEYNEDVICIAAPIFGKNDKLICTISIAAPSYRFSLEKAKTYSDELLKSSKVISQRLSE